MNLSGSDNDIFGKLMNFQDTGGATPERKLKPSERLLKDIEAHGFNMSELREVLTTKGNQLIISCAGSGKTTALVFKVQFDLKSGRATKVITVNGNSLRVPENIWVATFLKSGADELAASFRKWQYNLHCPDLSQAIQFSTLHAEFKRALNALGVSTEIISDKDNESLLKKVLKPYAIRNANGGYLNADDISALMGAFTYSRNRLDSSRYENDVYRELQLSPFLIDAILRDWKASRLKDSKCDFEDLQELLYDECYVKQNQDVIDFLAKRFAYIYVDEFQDTSQIQYALLQIYARDATIVAIGDDDQTIYSWRGSDISVITKKFRGDFSPTVCKLSTNYRCPENILGAIAPSIRMNSNRFPKDLKSYKAGGTVMYGGYQGYLQMVMSLGDMVYEDVKNGKSVAILCRVNSDGLLPALFFDKSGSFTFSVSGKNMTLDSYIGRLVMSIAKLFTDRATPSVQRALELLTWDSYCIKKLMEVLKANKSMSIWNIGPEDLRYSCPDIADVLLDWRSIRQTAGDITALKFVLSEYRTKVFNRESHFNDVVRSVLVSIESLLDVYKYDSVEDFLEDLESTNERLVARVKLKNARVRIATVHEFKGKEADCVYVWNDSEQVFPHKDSSDAIEDFEEERRIHYIACTRAREKSVVMYLRGRRGTFVDEMDLSNATEITGKTSGVLGGSIRETVETEVGLRVFEENTAVDTGEFDVD
jgi:DNA helicase-2/ATP-dependent DNA helicase PcrA